MDDPRDDPRVEMELMQIDYYVHPFIDRCTVSRGVMTMTWPSEMTADDIDTAAKWLELWHHKLKFCLRDGEGPHRCYKSPPHRRAVPAEESVAVPAPAASEKP